MTNATSDLAERFADALDRNDFAAAGELVSEDCAYSAASKEYRGRAEVMQSFMDASAWARERIERVTYRHSILLADDRAATIRFIDDLEHGGKRIIHECLMHLTLGGGGTIASLALEEPPGERDRVMALLREAGVEV